MEQRIEVQGELYAVAYFKGSLELQMAMWSLVG